MFQQGRLPRQHFSRPGRRYVLTSSSCWTDSECASHGTATRPVSTDPHSRPLPPHKHPDHPREPPTAPHIPDIPSTSCPSLLLHQDLAHYKALSHLSKGHGMSQAFIDNVSSCRRRKRSFTSRTDRRESLGRVTKDQSSTRYESSVPRVVCWAQNSFELIWSAQPRRMRTQLSSQCRFLKRD